MKRMVIATVLVASATAFGASIATASHTSVGAGVRMGFDGAETWVYENQAPCASSGAATPCSVTVDLGGRDYGRFKRACGYTDSSTNNETLLIAVGQNSSTNRFCNGRNGFQIRWFVFSDATVDHDLAVWVNLVVTR